jgi:hypothetical protein
MENLPKTHELSFFTEYYQFYIFDADSKAETDAPTFWNQEAEKLRLAIGAGILGVTVAKYAEIKVKIQFLEEKPAIIMEADHVVEASLRLLSGVLKVANCANFDTILEQKLLKTSYRIRISSFKLASVSSDAGDDFYVVEIWKSRFAPPKVLKMWNLKHP